jgi:TonB family protein
MTSVMRAVARPTGRRALRAALVRGGKIIEERVLAPGEDLTVGPTERSVFVVAGLAGSTRLIEASRAGYGLRLGRGMSGRIARGEGVVDVVETRAPVPLGDDARGRIAVGDALVLFHFVEPPAPTPRPQLPLAVRRGGFDGFDFKTTTIAAFSFLFHFGAMGTAYADFADTTVLDDGERSAAIIDMVRTLPPAPPPTEVPNDSAAKTNESAHPKEASAERPRSTGGHPKPSGGGTLGPSGPRESSGERAANARAHEIARQLESESKAMLEAIGGKNDGATGAVLAHSEVPSTLLDPVAADSRGAGANGQLAMGPGGGAVRPGAFSRGLPGPVDVKRDAHADDSGVQGGPRKPIPNATTAPPEVPVGKLPDAGRVIGGLRGLLRACYRHEIDTDPNARGTVRVTATVGPNGEVKSVQTANGGLSSAMASCVSRVVKGAVFNPPEGGSAIVTVPMTFIPQ